MSKIEHEYKEYSLGKEKVQGQISKVDEEFVYNYHLCGELIYDNDIKVCRRKIKAKYVESLSMIVNQWKGIDSV